MTPMGQPGTVVVVSPAAVVASVRLLSESLCALLVTAAVLLAVRYLQGARRRLAGWSGALMGLACLVRPICLPAAGVMALILAGTRRKRLGAVAFAAGAGALVVPWMGRNYLRTGYGNLAGVGDFNLFYCNAAALLEARPQTELTPAQARLVVLAESVEPWPDMRRLNDPGFLRTCRREGIALIRRNPLSYAAMHLRTTLNVFLPAATDVLEVLGTTAGGKGTLAVIRRDGVLAGVRHYFGGRTWLLWVCAPVVAITAAKFLAAVVGVGVHLRRRISPAGWLVALTAACFILLPGPVAHARFRVPVAGLLSLAAAVGIVRILRLLRQGTCPPEADPQARTDETWAARGVSPGGAGGIRRPGRSR